MAVNKQTVDKNSREYLTQKRNSGRSTLLTILIFTVINIVMLVVQADYYFLFSASVPYYLTLFGMIFDKFVVGTHTTSALVIAAVILGLFLLCWIFSKKRRGWLIAGLVLFVVDTLALLGFSMALEMLTDNILDFVFHGWAMVELVAAWKADRKLAELPPEMPEGYAGTTPELD
jgi:hypothetical protein